MRIPLYLPACKNCNLKNQTWIGLHDHYLNYTCKCGYDQSGSIAPSITVGYKGLYRSEYECNNTHDYSLSMVFSAMAFEWELTRLIKKWKSIESLETGEYKPSEKIEEEIRKLKTIYDKTKATGKLLYPKGFENYVKQDVELRTRLKNFPSLKLETLISDFQRNLFWPRNRIVHYGYDGYGREDAIKSYNIAYLGLVILNSMDNYRRKS